MKESHSKSKNDVNNSAYWILANTCFPIESFETQTHCLSVKKGGWQVLGRYWRHINIKIKLFCVIRSIEKQLKGNGFLTMWFRDIHSSMHVPPKMAADLN